MKRDQQRPLSERTDREGSGAARLTTARASSPTSELEGVWVVGEGAALEFHLDQPLGRGWVEFMVRTPLGENVFHATCKRTVAGDKMTERPSSFRCEFDEVLLLPGSYHVDVKIHQGEEVVDAIARATEIEVAAGILRGRSINAGWGGGVVAVPHRWFSA